MKSETAAIIEDLKRFLHVAEQLETASSPLSRMAEELGISPPTLTDTLKRLGGRYGGPLVTTVPGSKSANALTDTGREVFQFLTEPSNRTAPRGRVAVAVSQSLLTTDILSPHLHEFLRQYQEANEVAIEYGDGFEFASAAAAIERGELDLALSFRLDEPSGRRAEKGEWSLLQFDDSFSPTFDVVLVGGPGHDPARVAVSEKVSPATGRLAEARVATVNRDLEPTFVRAIRPKRPGWRRPLGSIDRVLTHVRTGLAQYGIVPAVYSTLDYLRQFDRLTYGKPIATAKLVLVSRKNTTHPPHVQAFADRLSQIIAPLNDPSSLAGYLNRPARGGLRFPSKADWFERLRWGYYVDHDRDDDNKPVPASTPKWRYETVTVRRADASEPRPGSAARLKFDGEIENGYDTIFRFTAELYGNVFTVRATQPPGGVPRQSVPEFQSVFAWCDENAEVMFGTWRDVDPDGTLVPYSTIWSARKLPLNELQAVASYASRTIGLSAARGDEPFDRHFKSKE